VGIHVNFAPDADVNNNPANPIINIRSFGEDPRTVGPWSRSTYAGLHEQGMLATLKHFPGHGDTETDSHIGLPVITAGYARLDSLELVRSAPASPPGRTCDERAHRVPSLTGPTIRRLCPRPVLTGLLRDSLRFPGLVVDRRPHDGRDRGEVRCRRSDVCERSSAGSDLLLIPAMPIPRSPR